MADTISEACIVPKSAESAKLKLEDFFPLDPGSEWRTSRPSNDSGRSDSFASPKTAAMMQPLSIVDANNRVLAQGSDDRLACGDRNDNTERSPESLKVDDGMTTDFFVRAVIKASTTGDDSRRAFQGYLRPPKGEEQRTAAEFQYQLHRVGLMKDQQDKIMQRLDTIKPRLSKDEVDQLMSTSPQRISEILTRKAKELYKD